MFGFGSNGQYCCQDGKQTDSELLPAAGARTSAMRFWYCSSRCALYAFTSRSASCLAWRKRSDLAARASARAAQSQAAPTTSALCCSMVCFRRRLLRCVC